MADLRELGSDVVLVALGGALAKLFDFLLAWKRGKTETKTGEAKITEGLQAQFLALLQAMEEARRREDTIWAEYTKERAENVVLKGQIAEYKHEIETLSKDQRVVRKQVEITEHNYLTAMNDLNAIKARLDQMDAQLEETKRRAAAEEASAQKEN